MSIGCVRIHLVVVVVIAVVVSLAGCSASPSEPIVNPAAVKARQAAGIADCPTPTSSSPQPSNGLPELTLPCLGGDVQVSLATLAGSMPLLINVWATWCGPCRTEAPFLAAVSADLGGQVQFIGIDHVDPDPLDAIAFAQEAGWTYPQLADPDGEGAQALGVVGIPQTLFVARDGTVVYRHRGAFDDETELRDLIASHLGVT